MSDEEFEEMSSEEIADAIEADMTPEEFEEYDRRMWALAWERLALAGEIDAANLISQQEKGR